MLDASVAVKWYLPEEGHEDAIELLRRAESEEVGLLAPSTIYPEFFNALWWQHRREGLPLEELRAPHGSSSPRTPFFCMRPRTRCTGRSRWPSTPAE